MAPLNEKEKAKEGVRGRVTRVVKRATYFEIAGETKEGKEVRRGAKDMEEVRQGTSRTQAHIRAQARATIKANERVRITGHQVDVSNAEVLTSRPIVISQAGRYEP